MTHAQAALHASFFVLTGLCVGTAHAQEKYIGELFATAGTFCPRGTIAAKGQTLSIQQYTPLFALIGITYGGNGSSNFRVPDMQGRSPIGEGSGPGLSSYSLGQAGGDEQQTLFAGNLPAHNHSVMSSASTLPATHATPASGRTLGTAQNAGIYVEATPNTQIATGMTGVTGQNLPVNIRNPFVAVNWCIVVEGLFPTRPD